MGNLFRRPAMMALVLTLLGAYPAHAQRPEQPFQAADSAPPPIPATRTDAPSPSYQVRSGDVVELNFPFVPTFNQTVTVEPDGYVTLQALGPVHVAGLTVPELMQTVSSKYVSVLRDPVVTAQLKELHRPYFVVAGDVERPGKYDLTGETTVTQAVAIAGGLREHAKASQAVVIHRLPGGGVETATLDLKKTMKQALLGTDPRLAPGDMLFIPHGRDFKVTDWFSALYILGVLY
jgi:polysaccharide export outer membrane protein